MKIDILGQKHHLSEREKIALECASGAEGLSIKKYQELCPETSKRTLQRELKHLLDIGLLRAEGITVDRRYFVVTNL